MKVRKLQRPTHPDFNDVVIHLTGRTTKAAAAEDCLHRILQEGVVRASLPYGIDQGAACFTESTSRGVCWLVARRHFAPFGIAFTKAYLFDQGGAPVLPVRGDEWHLVQALPSELRARVVRIWPGVILEPGESVPPAHLISRSEWLMEREWRVPAAVGAPAVSFALSDVAFLIVPNPQWIETQVRSFASGGHRILAKDLAKTRWLSIDEAGQITANNGVKLLR